jgi:AraC family transcriptional regulator
MRKNDRGVERAIEFSHGRVEISFYNWQREWNGIHRARPNMYIFELNLSHASKTPRPNRVETTSRSFQAGNVALIPPQNKVQRDIAAGWRRALFCMFDRGWLDDLLPRASGNALMEPVVPGRAEWLLRNIYQEMSRKADFGSAIVVESFANALAVELARRLASPRSDSGGPKGGLGPRRMHIVRKRVLSDIAAPSLTDLAELCDMTVRHLCRAFKTETGVTPGAYINEARAQHARTLLSQTSLSLTEIAHRLGFATSASFSNAFQRATGLRPRQIERPIGAALAS